MKTIIAGCRDFSDYACLQEVMFDVEQEAWLVSHVVSGAAQGADTLGEQWAKSNSTDVTRFPADWDTQGKAAGHIRNSLMADNAQALVAFWDGKSRGTKNMIDTAIKKGLYVKVFTYTRKDN